MHSYDYSQQSDDYKRIEKAIQYLEANFKSQPTLEKIAESVHLSKYHFDRMFKRWAGISPLQFQQFKKCGFKIELEQIDEHTGHPELLMVFPS